MQSIKGSLLPHIQFLRFSATAVACVSVCELRAQLFFYLGARKERREGVPVLLTWELSRRPTFTLSFEIFLLYCSVGEC
jgi:hypothetical protein